MQNYGVFCAGFQNIVFLTCTPSINKTTSSAIRRRSVVSSWNPNQMNHVDLPGLETTDSILANSDIISLELFSLPLLKITLRYAINATIKKTF